MDGGDRISDLPDEIIHHVLSFLPTTKLRAATSLLSRRWRHIWAHHSSLDFSLADTVPSPAAVEAAASAADLAAIQYFLLDFPAVIPTAIVTTAIDAAAAASSAAAAALAADYILSVDLCIRSFKAPDLHRFSADLWLPLSPPTSDAADRWLRFAGDRSVRNLQLRSTGESIIPASLFGCRSIVDLEILSATIPSVPSDFRGFTSLTSLDLYSVSIGNEDFKHLLSCCPLLRRLSMDWCDLPPFEVNHPNLTHLILLHGDGLLWPSIEAPNLVSITYIGDLEYLDWGGSPVLRHASIRRAPRTKFDTRESWERLLAAVSNVDALTVDEWFYQFVIPKPFMLKNLKELELDVQWITGSLLNAIVGSVTECKLLEILHINFRNYLERRNSFGAYISDDPPAFKYNRELLELVHLSFEQDEYDLPKLFVEPRCSLCKLRTIIISGGFMGSTNEMLLVEFLLGNTVALENFIVKHSLRGDEEELQKLFAPIPRASSQVLLKL